MNIKSVEILGKRICRNPDWLQNIADDIDNQYHTFKKNISGKLRKFYVPHNQLRHALLAIRGLLREVYLPDEIIGGRKGSRLVDFARPHVHKPCILKLDIKNFFPSVGHRLVYHMFLHRLDCSPPVASLLARLLAPDGHVPQGFNTSTDMGNLALLPIVERIRGLANQQGFNLTVWVDNIVLSGGAKLEDFQRLCETIIRDTGFDYSESQVVPETRRQEICGVVVNTKLSVPEARRKDILWMLHRIELGDLAAVCTGKIDSVSELRKHLAGKIGSVEQVNRKQGRPLRKKFGALPWDELLELDSFNSA